MSRMIHSATYRSGGLLGTELLRRMSDVGRSWGLDITMVREGGWFRERGTITVIGDEEMVERWWAMARRLSRAMEG